MKNSIKIWALSAVLLLAFTCTYSYAQESQKADAKTTEKNVAKEEKSNQNKFSNLKKQKEDGDAEENTTTEKPSGSEGQSQVTDDQKDKPEKPAATGDQKGKGKPPKVKDYPKQPKEGEAASADEEASGKGKPSKPMAKPQKPEGPKEKGDGEQVKEPHGHKDSLKREDKAPKSEASDSKGHAYGKDKAGLEGKEFGQARAEEARKHKEEMKTGLVNSVATGETKVAEARDKIKTAREELEKQKQGKKITLTQYHAQKEKIDAAEKSVDALESKLQEGKKLSAE